MASKTYRSHSPGLRVAGVVFGGAGASVPALGLPLTGQVDEVDALRRRGRVPRHSGNRTRTIGRDRGSFTTSDVALQRAIEASPLFADGSIWIEG
jgi:hypothetical protein